MELSSRSFSNMQLRKQQPNKRLKLAGADRFKRSGGLCPWRGTDCRPLLLRRRASRPQLKRDPLGRPSTMRVYSTRERDLAGLTVPMWLAVVVIVAGVVATMPEMRTNLLLWA